MVFRGRIAILALLFISPGLIFAQSEDRQQLFNGSSLSGWSTDSGQWQAKDGEIIGSAKNGDGGWLDD